MDWYKWTIEELERVSQYLAICDDSLVVKVLTVYQAQMRRLSQSLKPKD